ncbi:hypothetical protein BHE97_15545 [Aeromicrobium sp. PE09-221]|uniref:hemolysin family protein n=1 Tax=Aeromicrobium sp. PE09-221 TaxID=1898043 RepID=UPI000B3E4C63|nr:hemolysin family protein [Aeromicrobium sp. PE09-221]OUZ07794.1 hypothetical protein BHE97_15545 [Aeromicrobium sp. PE09-221]
MSVVYLLLGLVVVFVITVATAYFVAQEFAYMAVDRSRLKARAAAGDAVSARTLQVTGRTSFMLSGAQLGITVTGLLVGYVAEPLIGESFGDILGGAGVSTAAGVMIGTIIALLLSTIIQMLFGELFPKNLAIAQPEPVARALSRSTLIYLKLFGWLITVFDHASNLLLRALKIEPVHDVESSATVRDLEHIVAESRESGDLSPELSMMVDRILDFPRQDVEHAMVPRSRVDVIESDESIGTLREQMAAGHSRYPVMEDDRVVGVVHLVDVLGGCDENATVATIMRDALVIPELMPLPNALAAFGDTNEQLACVVDEHGSFTGVLTPEDLAEEFVGEIADEYDDLFPVAELEGTGVWRLSGDSHIDEVERLLERDLPEGDYETLSGLVIATLGRLPDEGDVVRVELPPDPGAVALGEELEPEFLDVTVLELRDHVPSAVRLTLPEPATSGQEADDE